MTDNIGRAALKAFAERLIRLEDEKDALVSDIKEVKAEAKATGYNPKVLNAAIRIARMTAEQRGEVEQFQMELDLYVDAIMGTGE